MADPNIFVLLGLKTQDLVAGLSGGVVNAIVFKRSNPVAIIGSMLVGALTANYLGEYGAKYVGTSEGASSFLVGLCGMIICQLIVAAAAKWSPPFLKPGTDD